MQNILSPLKFMCPRRMELLMVSVTESSVWTSIFMNYLCIAAAVILYVYSVTIRRQTSYLSSFALPIPSFFLLQLVVITRP